MCIKPELQRSGIGTKQYSELEKELIEKQIRSIYFANNTTFQLPCFIRKGFKRSEEMSFFQKEYFDPSKIEVARWVTISILYTTTNFDIQ